VIYRFTDVDNRHLVVWRGRVMSLTQALALIAVHFQYGTPRNVDSENLEFFKKNSDIFRHEADPDRISIPSVSVSAITEHEIKTVLDKYDVLQVLEFFAPQHVRETSFYHDSEQALSV